ncbi:MAG: binary toxin-like calcium binding domain-containing protein [Methanobacteriota archaeon]
MAGSPFIGLRLLLIRRFPVVLGVLVLLVPIVAGVAFVAAGGRGGRPSLQTNPDDPVSNSTFGLFADTDRDSLTDILENYAFGTNLSDWNSSGTGIPDGWLARFGYDPRDRTLASRFAAFPGAGEAPAAFGPEGLPATYRMTVSEVYSYRRPADWDEATKGPWDSGLDPTRTDMTGSGLPYAWLVHHGLDPLDPTLPDRKLSGPSGLTVREAYERGTDPTRLDSDDDGLTDAREIAETKTDPTRFSTADTGIADGWLVFFALDPFARSVATEDADRDGLTNLEEFAWSHARFGNRSATDGEGLSPRLQTTGGLPIPDGWLVRYGLDPFDPTVPSRVLQNASDHPDVRDLRPSPGGNHTIPDVSLTILDAYRYGRPPTWREASDGPWFAGLDPTTRDTDRDGLPDAVEIRGWSVRVVRAVGTNDSEVSTVRSDPRLSDSDGDGLEDAEEFLGRTLTAGRTFAPTDPGSRDTDFDALPDGEEIRTSFRVGAQTIGLDPTRVDTDGDTLPDGVELSYWRSRAGRVAASTQYEFNATKTTVSSWLTELPWVRSANPRPSESFLLAQFAPDGDLDNDTLPNLLDGDADADGLPDGWEVLPENYRFSPFATGNVKSATDPANPDTDTDGLPDAWETEYQTFDFSIGGWNLDPSEWSSFHDGVSDADKDLDRDATSYLVYRLEGGSARALERVFNASNRDEFTARTHPTKPDTDGDGLPDGWEIFWGDVYPFLGDAGDVAPRDAGGRFAVPDGDRPDALRDRTGDVPQAAVATETYVYRRFGPTAALAPTETLV